MMKGSTRVCCSERRREDCRAAEIKKYYKGARIHPLTKWQPEPFYLLLYFIRVFETKATMNYKFTSLQPPQHLRFVVKNFFTLEYHNDVVHTDYLLPDGLPSLFCIQTDEPVIFYFGKRAMKLRQGFHAGYSNTIVKFRHGRFKIVGASVFPVHFHRISDKTLPDIMNRFIRLDELAFAKTITWPLRSASSEMVVMLENHITTQLTGNKYDQTFFEIYRRLARPGGYGLRIDRLAEELGYSTRSLHAHFSRHFGMPPKRFIKLLRFNYALKYLYDQNSTRNLSAIAHEAGYHDQSHLIRDFKSICGKTPGEISKKSLALASNFRLF
jgi:AraC-like DNA-binding protein